MGAVREGLLGVEGKPWGGGSGEPRIGEPGRASLGSPRVRGQPSDWVCAFPRLTQLSGPCVLPGGQELDSAGRGFYQAGAQTEKQGQDLAYGVGLKLAKRG